MPIMPLPQFEADLEEDRKLYDKLKPPSSIVVRFGVMKLVGEFPYQGDAKPGCGSKLVVKTHRGVELGEMLTSTCPNAGCSKSVTRKEMLEYIENSGGRDYPFFSMQGRVLRVATPEDLAAQAAVDATKPALLREAREISRRLSLPMKVVEVEPILGGEKITYYFVSEERVDFRELVSELAGVHRTRIDLKQVGARDEARLTADYERCGQHCCCKQFLKVLKPVSMRSAKIQKATLDPLKISGRCGRLMCCLRYEDQTYDDLRARLPKKKTRVRTPEGLGIVLDTQILTQLVLVLLDEPTKARAGVGGGGEERIAVPVEEIEVLKPGTPGYVPPPVFGAAGTPAAGPDQRRERAERPRAERPIGRTPPEQGRRPEAPDQGAGRGGERGRARGGPPRPAAPHPLDDFGEIDTGEFDTGGASPQSGEGVGDGESATGGGDSGGEPRRRRRGRRRGRRGRSNGGPGGGGGSGGGEGGNGGGGGSRSDGAPDGGGTG